MELLVSIVVVTVLVFILLKGADTTKEEVKREKEKAYKIDQKTLQSNKLVLESIKSQQSTLTVRVTKVDGSVISGTKQIKSRRECVPPRSRPHREGYGKYLKVLQTYAKPSTDLVQEEIQRIKVGLKDGITLGNTYIPLHSISEVNFEVVHEGYDNATN